MADCFTTEIRNLLLVAHYLRLEGFENKLRLPEITNNSALEHERIKSIVCTHNTTVLLNGSLIFSFSCCSIHSDFLLRLCFNGS